MESRMTRGEVIFPSLLFVVIAGLLIVGRLVLGYSWTVIAFPFGAGVIVCGLCIVQVAAVITGRQTQVVDEDPLEPLTLSGLIWVFALAPFLFGLGFIFGTAACLLVCLRANGASWRLSAIIAAASFLVTWVMFVKFLQVPLPMWPLWIQQ
jgi:hypothetical protein